MPLRHLWITNSLFEANSTCSVFPNELRHLIQEIIGRYSAVSLALAYQFLPATVR